MPKLHLLDLAGPAQVFSTANDLGYGYELRYVAEAEEITTAQGVPVRAQLEWPELGPADLVVVPGWRSPRLSPDDRRSDRDVAAAAACSPRGGWHRSRACAPGADALGAAGLLDGRRFTTHHDLTDELAAPLPEGRPSSGTSCTSWTTG